MGTTPINNIRVKNPDDQLDSLLPLGCIIFDLNTKLSYTLVEYNIVTDTLTELIATGAAAPNIPITSDSVIWKNIWTEGAYLKDDMVRDGNWAMIANRATEDRPAPQLYGSPETTSPTTFADQNTPIGTVQSGHRYTFSTARFVTGLYAYIPDASPDITYDVLVIKDPTGAATTALYPILDPTVGWYHVANLGFTMPTGSELEIRLLTTNHATDTTVTVEMEYQGMASSNVGAGEWNMNPANTLFRIANVDINASNIEAQLSTIEVGSLIKAVDLSDAGNTVTYLVSEIRAPNQGVYSYVVTQVDYSGVDIAVGQVCTLEFTTAVPATTPYDMTENYWISNEPAYFDAAGYLTVAGAAIASQEDNCFGVDIETQGISVSDAWDIIAVSSGGGIGTSPYVAANGTGTSPYVPFYEYTKVADITVPNTTYVDIAEVIAVNVNAGTYEYKFSASYTMSSTSNPVYFRFSIDGGTNWEYFSKENKDSDDITSIDYFFPKEVAQGETIQLYLQAAKENANSTMIVTFADVVLHKVK